MSLQVNVMGQTLTPDIRSWHNKQRKVGSLLALYSAIAITVIAIVLWLAWGGPRITYWVLLILLVLVLLFMIALMVMTPPKPKAAAEAAGGAPTTDPAVLAALQDTPAQAETAIPVASEGPRVITLRCGDCGTIFDVNDNGERPLYHTCPGCGAEGALQDEPVAAAEPAPEAAPAWAPPAEPAPAPAAAAAPAMKKLRLRCGGCKEIFSIEDTGERPLKRPCPHCGRMGQIS